MAAGRSESFPSPCPVEWPLGSPDKRTVKVKCLVARTAGLDIPWMAGVWVVWRQMVGPSLWKVDMKTMVSSGWGWGMRKKQGTSLSGSDVLCSKETLPCLLATVHRQGRRTGHGIADSEAPGKTRRAGDHPSLRGVICTEE